MSFDWPDEDPPATPNQQERKSGCWPFFATLLAVGTGALVLAAHELVQALA